MRKLSFLRPLLWSWIFLTFLGCKKDHVLTGNDVSDFSILVSYEEETRSSYLNLSPAAEKNDAAVLDQEVNACRQQVKIGILDDGSSVMEMKRMKPKHSASIPEKEPPAQADEVHSMRFEYGQVRMYNANGDQIGQEKADIPSYKDLIKQVKENKKTLTRAMYGDFLAAQRLKSTENGQVSVTEEGDFTITSKIVGPEDGMDPSMNGYTVTDYHETATGILVGSSILDETGKTVYRSVMTYDEDPNNPLPAFSHEESFGTSEDGEEFMITTLRYIENVEIVVE